MGEKEDDDLSNGVVAIRPDLVKKALSRGADPNVTIQDVSVLHIAALTGSLANVDMLLQAGADANGRGTCADTPLHFLSMSKSPNCGLIARSLIGHGADVNRRGIEGRSPLDAASLSKNKTLARVLAGSGGKCAFPENESWVEQVRMKGRSR